MTERENIEEFQKMLGRMKAICREEMKRADTPDQARVKAAWSKADAKTRKFHNKLTDLLMENYPGFAAEVVAFGPGGR